MNIEKSRKEFEEWYLAEFYEGDKQCGLEWLSTEPCGGYRYSAAAESWKAWQASRAALVIELPEKDPAGTGGGDCGDGRPSEEQCVAAYCNIVLAQCRAAIETAGVKVKS